nr:peptidase inhibitor family I36 protein [Streptomyces rubrogriseus]
MAATANAAPQAWACNDGSFCVYSADNGTGSVCGWSGDDPDWRNGTSVCGWAGGTRVQCAYNNGLSGARCPHTPPSTTAGPPCSASRGDSRATWPQSEPISGHTPGPADALPGAPPRRRFGCVDAVALVGAPTAGLGYRTGGDLELAVTRTARPRSTSLARDTPGVGPAHQSQLLYSWANWQSHDVDCLACRTRAAPNSPHHQLHRRSCPRGPDPATA